MIADIFIETNYPLLAMVDLQTDKLPEKSSLKLLQITDLHDKDFGKNESRLLDMVKGAKPDIIAITGDYADHTTRDFTNLLYLASCFKTVTPDVFYVPGNHEQESTAMKELFDGLSERGVHVLMNSGFIYEKDNFKMNICGINFPFRETSYKSGQAAERSAVEESRQGIYAGAYSVLLSHSPRIADSIRGRPFDLILSGHTHGGQVRFPVIGNPFKLNEDFFGGYDKGLFKLDSGAELYVDSGLGTSIYPVRFCNRAQISLITVSGR